MEDKLISIDKELLLDQTKDVSKSIKAIAELIYPAVDFEVPPPPVSSDNEKK